VASPNPYYTIRNRLLRPTAIGLAAAGLAAALVLGACGTDDPADDMTDDMTSEAADDMTEDMDDDAAMDDTEVPANLAFTATTVDGDAFDGAVLAGSPTVLWFWEHDCPICISQGPDVKALTADYGGRVDVVGVSGSGIYSGSSDGDRLGFVDQTGTGDAVHIVDEDYTLRTGFDVFSQSTFVILDADGEIVDTGSFSGNQLRDKVDALL
jgi:cytochrome oxidase Cu insertion factor (SCO1/SenC/PrrC family)